MASSPPALPEFALPSGRRPGETTLPHYIYVPVPASSHLAKAGSDLLKKITVGSGVVLVAAVLLDAVLPPELSPATFVSNFQAHMFVNYQNGTRQAQADTARALADAQVDAQNRADLTGPAAKLGGLAILGCLLGGSVTSSLQRNGHYDGANTAQDVTQDACAMGRAAMGMYGVSPSR